MAQLVRVPLERVPQEQLEALLEEYASRDGTDYGSEETSLSDRVTQLQSQLRSAKLQLLFDVDSQQWDIVSAEDAQRLLGDGEDA
ncbi:YheU family protein [Congregibacter variabilis]|uniref:YheU family protein n=1 Tax=Congregibacter variabilis TaxID=3081200 RepID=A0ABZ0I5C9_9GAMM|nr:YheU family protein [Congregibacter sp. IMCC43200]